MRHSGDLWLCVTIYRYKGVNRNDIYDGLRVFYTKRRSLRNKTDVLSMGFLTSAEKLNIKAITESWMALGGKHFSLQFELKRYYIFHVDRLEKRGGGVALYAKDTVTSYINTSTKTDGNVESI